MRFFPDCLTIFSPPLAANPPTRHAPVVLSPKNIVALTRVFLRDARIRRSLMFYIALAALLMVFIGSALIDSTLRAYPFLFLGYWGVCAWLTVTCALLAIFDLLIVRAAGRAARRQLERDLIPDDKDDPHTR